MNQDVSAASAQAQLIKMAKRNLVHVDAGTIEQTDTILKIPAANYYDEAHWEAEMKAVFRRLPLMMALSVELQNSGDYKTMTVAGVPILLTRNKSGEAQAYLNSCSHRGAQIMTEPNGNARQFSCPYHAWTYNLSGELIAVYGEREFGDVDRSCNSLVKLPTFERAGLVWVTLDPDSQLPIESFLSGYDALLAQFGFSDWHLFDTRTIKGPNWKIAYDGYLDLYHLPILHKDTFGPDMPSKALYTAWGPHQRASSPDPSLTKLVDLPEEQWDSQSLLNGVWTIFPHVSIASFDAGGRGVMISQLFPGTDVSESYTTQFYLMEKPPKDAATEAEAHKQFAMLEMVVRDEDYATGLRQQQALASGMKEHVMFGRNEGGGQLFHAWLDKLLATSDDSVPDLFQS